MNTVIGSARRLALSAAEWAVLCRHATFRPPPGFAASVMPEEDLAVAAGFLVDRGVLTTVADGPQAPVHASVLANLAVWASPQALVRLELSVRGRGLRAMYAVRGPVGGSLVTLSGGGVELSMFPAVALGRELVRCLPQTPQDAGMAGQISASLGGTSPSAQALRGRVPLAALAEVGAARPFAHPDDIAAGLKATDVEAALAAELTSRTVGVLWCTATGAEPDPAATAARVVLAGQVVWLATDAGWLGLRPHADGTDRRLVDLVPVDRDDIGTWVAPYLARILEEAVDG